MTQGLELQGIALLSTELQSEEVVKAAQSVPVRAFVVSPGAPAPSGQLLVEVDTVQLQRELGDAQAELKKIQTDRRNSPFGVAQDSREPAILQEILDLQRKLTSAPVRAPADGFVVRYLVHPGSRTKRRKPVLTFAELSKTLVKTTLKSEPSEPLAIGSEVFVSSASDPSEAFRARLVRLERISGGATVYVLVPKTLPFLHLNAAAEVVLSEKPAAGLPVSAEKAPLQPSERPPSFGESVEVEVVNIDVVVTDKDGRRVRDLKQDDFVVEVEGRVVPIEYFAAPRVWRELAADPSQTGEPQTQEEAASLPTSLLVFLDLSALDVNGSKILIEQLRRYVMSRAQAGDRTWIAAFSDNFRLICQGSTDFAAIESAMNELAKIPAGGTRLAADRDQIEREIRRRGQVQSGSESPSTPLDAGALGGEIRVLADQEVERQRRLLGALSAWITTFSRIEGRKNLLLATPGFSANPTAYLSELADRQKRGIAQDGGVRRGALQDTDVNVYADFEQLLLKAQDARISVHTIAPREPPPLSNSPQFGSLGTGASAPPPRDASIAETASSLARLAGATGGRSFAIDPLLAGSLDEVTEDGDAGYSLGFTTGPEAGTKLQKINVRLRRSDLEARHRDSFRRRTPIERIEEALVAAATIDNLYPEFELTLEPGPVVAPKHGYKVLTIPIAVRVPIASIGLAPEGEERHGMRGSRYQGVIRVRFAVRDEKGRIRLGEESRVEVAIPEADLERARSSAWVHRSEIVVNPGKQRVAVVVVDEASGAYATMAKDVAVPAN